MPITQLMSKLSGKFDSTKRSAAPAAHRSTGDSMESSNKSFDVVVEVLPNGPGAACSMGGDGAAAMEEQQSAPSEALRTHLSSSSSAALLASSSLSGPMTSLQSTHSGPATERALRAKGKAMMRTESGLSPIAAATSGPAVVDLQHQLSLDSSSSMVDAQCGSLQHTQGSHMASPRFNRCLTAPLPGSSRAGADSRGQEPAAAFKAMQAAAAAAEVSEDECDDDDELVHPISPSAAAADDGSEHCHWEDGVLASWLQGIDHGEQLLQPVEECDGEEEASGAGPSCSRAALPASMSMPSPYSSLLYN